MSTVDFESVCAAACPAREQDQDEMEANRFAAEILMPIDFLRNDLKGREFDLADDNELRSLARRYGVSTQALAIRLNSLGYSIEAVSG